MRTPRSPVAPPGRLDRRQFLVLGTGVVASLAGAGCEPSSAAGLVVGGDVLVDDAGRPPALGDDAGTEVTDAGVADAGASGEDAGGVGAHDAGTSDAGTSDAGAEDAGSPGVDPATFPEAPLATFPMAVSSGDVEPTSAVFQTCYRGSASLELLVWLEGTTRATSHPVTVESGGFVHLTAGGLTPGAWHQYAFVETSGPRLRSPVGRLRAAFDGSALLPLSFGATSCAFNYFDPHATLERAGARSDLDLFLLLGDTSYNDGCSSVADYRQRWEDNLKKNGYRALRGKTSVLATWDDHEVGNNWSPETIDPALLARARQVFFENLPLRRLAGAPDRLWRSFRWGLTAEFFVLDGRSERRPSTRTTPGAVYLSRAQMDWLKNGLAASPAVFKVILNSVPAANFPASFNLGQVLLDPADRWQGYKAAQDELLGFIEGTPVRGVLFLSGDFHLACAGRCAASGLGSQTVELVVGPANQVVNPLDGFLTPPQWDIAHREKNYAAVHLDPQARTARVVYHRGDGVGFVEHTYAL